jgi:MFS family permease
LALVVVAGAIAPLVDTTVVNVALPAMSADVHAGTAAIQWATTAYLLTLAVTVPVTAWASDRFGAKRLWIAGLVLFLIGSGLCALAWDFGSLVAFRALQGVGAGIMLPVLQTILVRAAGPAKTGRVLTIVVLAGTVAPIAGPLVGGSGRRRGQLAVGVRDQPAALRGLISAALAARARRSRSGCSPTGRSARRPPPCSSPEPPSTALSSCCRSSSSSSAASPR